MSQDAKSEFSKWRAFFWPVHGFELKKILPMLLMFFGISFNYTILRDTKDTLIVSNCGAEAIPFLKVYGVVPMAILFMLVYSKLSNMLSKESLFYTTIAPFLAFFGLFAFVFYPNRAMFQPNDFADYLRSVLPIGCYGFIECIRHWIYSVFYIFSELWGSAMISLVFWGFANDITKVTEAKRFYALFGLGANVALIFSGRAIRYACDIRTSLPEGADAWQVSLNYLMTMVVLAGILVIGVYYWINRNVMTDTRFFNQNELAKAKKEKPKMSITESLLFLAKSPYILCIAVLVFAYGVSINLVEVTWKGQLKLQYTNENDYNTFMGYFSEITGWVTLGMMLFVGGNALRKGWGFAAMITPVVLLLTGMGFFAFILLQDNVTVLSYISMLGTTPLFLAVLFGMIQNIMSKSAKYSLFDPTKEIAYIPLDQESKVKGKAAIDVVGARLGKSGGSIVQQVLLVACGSMAAITPYIAIILFAIIGAWILAVRSLNKRFTELTAQKQQAAPAEEAPAKAKRPAKTAGASA